MTDVDLSELVSEIRRGQATTLNKLCSEPLSTLDTAVCRIHTILVALVEEEYTSGAGLPADLKYSSHRFYFKGQRQESYSRSALKKYLFQILRRLFEALPASSLQSRGWLCQESMDIVTCIRELASDLSVVLYLISGLNVEDPTRDLPDNIQVAVRSILIDFAELHGDSKVVGDLAMANISCTFLVKYHRLLASADDHVSQTIASFVCVNCKRRLDNRWPYMKALLRLNCPAVLGNKWNGRHHLTSIARSIIERLPEALEDETFGKEHVQYLLKYHQFFEQRLLASDDAAHLFARLPQGLAYEVKEDLIVLFFHVFMKRPMERDAAKWLDQAKERSMSDDPTGLLLLAMSYNERRLCPLLFIEHWIERHSTSLNLVQVVTSREFSGLIERVFLKTRGKASLLNMFDSSKLLEAAVKHGLLRRLFDYNGDRTFLSCHANDLMIRALVYEDDEMIVRTALEKCLQYSERPWKEWPFTKLEAFLDKHLGLLSQKQIVELIKCYRKRKDRLHLLLRKLSVQTGYELLQSHNIVFPKGIQVDTVPWLLPRDDDELDVRLRKQLIARRISLTDAIKYATGSKASRRLKSMLYRSSSMAPRFDLGRLAAAYGRETPRFKRSPVIGYAQSLCGGCPQLSVRPVRALLRDFFLLPVVSTARALSHRFTGVHMRECLDLPIEAIRKEKLLIGMIVKMILLANITDPESYFGTKWVDQFCKVAEAEFPPPTGLEGVESESDESGYSSDPCSSIIDDDELERFEDSSDCENKAL